jgi:hypothetical protein
MRRLLVTVVVIAAFGVPAAYAFAGQAHVVSSSQQCGSFKYGTDGGQPGPSGIKANHVSCWFARATALVGAAPGWHCRVTVGITLVCRPRHGNRAVTFFGE